ncbi:putative tail fiber [uncultured Mediterranean phage uvMED]|nr:putative tail fiber [uncultured Mediterranean phage uvMED]
MTVSSSTIKNSYSGDGSTTAFAYGFKIFAAADLTVIIRSSTGVETVKTITTHYDVSNVGVDGGGNVTFGSAPASGETVVIIRSTANTQTLDLVENDPFLSNSFEESLDKITHQLIEQQEEIDRSFKVSRTNSITTSEFADDATSRASKTLGFDSDGNLTTVADFLPIGGDSAQFTYSTTTTDSDPGSGAVRFNNANLASATIAYIDDLEANGTDVSAWVQSFDNVVGNDTNRGRIRISKANSLVVWAVYKVTGAVVDASGYTKVNLVYIDSAGTLANNDKVFISFVSSGEDGAIPGYYYKFDTGTSDADPGAGEIAFNNGTYASATAIYIDDSDANGVTTSTDVLTWDDSTSSIKGSLMIYDINDRSTYARFNITGSSTDASGYNKLAVTHVASNNTFSAADELSVHFSRSGNKGDTGTTGNTGDTGSTGSTGASGTNSQLAMTWSSSTSDADPGAGKIAFNHGTVGSVSILYIDDADDASADISGFVQSWDDVSNATARGIVTVTKEGTPATYATFKVSGAVTDASGYTKIPVTHLTSNGSFSNTDGVGVHFSYSGADGSGDIEGVTAGTNLSGGGTSGTVTVNLADSAADTKGAVIVAGNAPASIGYSSGTATISIADSGASTKGAVIVAGTSPVSVGYSSGTATVAVSDASTSAKGIASFASADFAVSSGAVTLEAAVAKTDEQNTFTKAQVPSTYTAALSATSGVLDYDSYTNFIITLASGSNTLAAPTTEASQVGQSGVIIFIQPSSSSAGTVSLHGDYETAAAAGLTLSSANNDYDIVPYFIKADNSILLGTPQLNFG